MRRRIGRRGFLQTSGVAATGLAAAAAFGCGSDDDDETTTATATGTASATGTATGSATGTSTASATAAKPAGSIKVSVATLQEQSASPFFQTGGLSSPIYFHAYEGFFGGDLAAKSTPRLALSMEQPEPTTITFKLRPGVKFWDGTDVTAEDIKWSFDAYVGNNPPAPPSAKIKNSVTSVDITGTDTITIKFKTPVVFQMEEMGVTGVSRGWPVSSRAHYEKVGAEGFKSQPMGTGPFAVKENKVGQYIDLVANELYWNKAWVPRVQNVRLNIVPDQQTRIAQIKTGEADIIEGIIGPAAETLKNESSIKIVKTDNTAQMTVRFQDLWDPATTSVQKDPRFREAMKLAVDQESIAKNLLKLGAPGPDILVFPNSTGYDANMFKPLKRDVAKAKDLIKQAGAEGQEFRLGSYSSSSYPMIPEIMQAYASFWKEIGINTKIETKESGAYFTDFQAKTPRGLGPISFPNFSNGGILLVTYYKKGGAYATTDNDDEIQALIGKLETEIDPKAQEELIKQGLKLAYDKHYFIAAPYVESQWAISSKIKSWERQAGLPYVNSLQTVTL
ncbi:MAG: ABC transporter substrate-binding protein [Dehalococcoidia bacterium]|nr:ABC transporter substrate-binding protein [Dehalococcoidia bacterium]